MSKLGVDVGDEFPAEEIHRDEDGAVHHHHYHYRRRRYRGPFGFLRFMLVIMLITLGWRLVGWATFPFDWHGPDRYAGPPFFGAGPFFGSFFALGGLIVAIAAIGAALWFLRNRDIDGER
jgi:hypothetical protein